jgi:hypothetical protein
MKHILIPKSYKHETIPQTNVRFVEKSVDIVEKHIEKIHEGIGKSCTICEEALTISKMKRHLRSMHETPRNTCEACRHTQRKSHSNNQIIETKNDNIEGCPFCDPKFQTKDVLKDPVTNIHVKKQNFLCEDCQKAVKYRTGLLRHMKWHEYPKMLRFPPSNITVSAATPEDEIKNEANNGIEEKYEAEHGEDEKANKPTTNANESKANDDKAKDDAAANLRVEKTEPKSQNEPKAKYKLIPD